MTEETEDEIDKQVHRQRPSSEFSSSSLCGYKSKLSLAKFPFASVQIFSLCFQSTMHVVDSFSRFFGFLALSLQFLAQAMLRHIQNGDTQTVVQIENILSKSQSDFITATIVINIKQGARIPYHHS